MPDERPSVQVKASRAEDAKLVVEFKAALDGMGIAEAKVLLDLIGAYMECAKRDKALPKPPFVLRSSPRV